MCGVRIVVNVSVSIVLGLMVNLKVLSSGMCDSVSSLKLVIVVRFVISSDISVYGVMGCVFVCW